MKARCIGLFVCVASLGSVFCNPAAAQILPPPPNVDVILLPGTQFLAEVRGTVAGAVNWTPANADTGVIQTITDLRAVAFGNASSLAGAVILTAEADVVIGPGVWHKLIDTGCNFLYQGAVIDPDTPATWGFGTAAVQSGTVVLPPPGGPGGPGPGGPGPGPGGPGPGPAPIAGGALVYQVDPTFPPGPLSLESDIMMETTGTDNVLGGLFTPGAFMGAFVNRAANPNGGHIVQAIFNLPNGTWFINVNEPTVTNGVQTANPRFRVAGPNFFELSSAQQLVQPGEFVNVGHALQCFSQTTDIFQRNAVIDVVALVESAVP